MANGENVLAQLGDLSIPLPDGRKYRLVGGHRLWVAPEDPPVTYAPDDRAVVVTQTQHELTVTGPPEVATRLEKSISISLHDGGVRLVHRITNRGTSSRMLAPWAITQFPVGGTALLPLNDQDEDDYGLQPNAEVVLWPYAGVADTPFVMKDRLLLIGSDRTSPTKVGTRLDRGWLAYIRNGLVFVKRAGRESDGTYADRGASAQCYSSPDFVELETLGAVGSLQPGDTTEHVELWNLYTVSPDVPLADVPTLLDLDGGHPE